MADLARAVNIADLRRLAQRRLPRAIFDFFDGGAEDEVTLRDNCSAFQRVRLLPRVLVDVAAVRMSSRVCCVETTVQRANTGTARVLTSASRT